MISLLRVDFDAGLGLAKAPSIYHAARIVGETVRKVSDIDRASLERDHFTFNVNLLLGGQVRGEPPALYLIYPQGNPLQATEDSPYLQLGEVKYGRPILDRGIQSATSLEIAAKYALLSFDATMRSNVTVGPPIDLLLYKRDSFRITRYRRLGASDPDLNLIHESWETVAAPGGRAVAGDRVRRIPGPGGRPFDRLRVAPGRRPAVNSLQSFRLDRCIANRHDNVPASP